MEHERFNKGTKRIVPVCVPFLCSFFRQKRYTRFDFSIAAHKMLCTFSMYLYCVPFILSALGTHIRLYCLPFLLQLYLYVKEHKILKVHKRFDRGLHPVCLIGTKQGQHRFILQSLQVSNGDSRGLHSKGMIGTQGVNKMFACLRLDRDTKGALKVYISTA